MHLSDAFVGALIAVVASIFGALANVFGGTASRRISTTDMLAVGGLATVPFVSVALYLTRDRVVGLDLLWGLSAGVVSTSGVFFLYRSMRLVPVGLVAAAAGISGTLTPVVYTVIRGDFPSPLVWVGIAFAIPATWFMAPIARKRIVGEVHFRQLVPAMIAGVLFAGGAISFSRISKNDLFAGSFGICTLKFAIFTVPFLMKRGKPKVERIGVRLALLAAISYVAVDIGVLVSTHKANIAVVSTILNTSTLWTALIGFAFLQERLSRRQLAGMGLSVLTLSLVAIGAN